MRVITEACNIVRQEKIPIFINLGEMRAVTGTLGNQKAPEPDEIPTEVITIIAKQAPYLLLNIYNACLLTGVFA